MLIRLFRRISTMLVVSMTIILLAQCTTLPTMKHIDSTEDYRGLGYPDQRKIARDSHGTLFVAYRKKYQADTSTNYHIFVAKSTNDGASWEVLNNNRPIEQVGNYMQRVPTIAIDGRDVIHVVWYGQDERNTGENQRQIKYVRSIDGGAHWSPWTNVGEVEGYDGQRLWQEHPTLAVSGANVYVAWQGLDPDNPKSSQVRLAHSSDSGATWDPWRSINPVARGNRSRPSIVASADGKRLYVLAYGGVGTPQQIVWTMSSDGGQSWSAWAPVAETATDQRHVSVALDTQGRVHAVWRQVNNENKAEVVYAILDGTTWSASYTVQPSDANQFFPTIAIANDNSVWAAWIESTDAAKLPEDDPQGGTLVVAHKSATGSWQRLEPPVAQGNDNIYPSLRWSETANGGNVDLVWLQRSSDQWQVLFSAISAGQ